ncbi:MAG: hypothetical protein LBR36_00395, partial [Bacteroidales bacterium]|nr:hypothetical protein [Bacteroidales bacterium]
MKKQIIVKRKLKKAATTVCLLMMMTLGVKQIGFAQPTITPGTNPSEVVQMGDSLLFTVTIQNTGAAYNNAEMEIVVPAGFELLTTTPDFLAGSLSVDKLTGRIRFNIPSGGAVNKTIYV